MKISRLLLSLTIFTLSCLACTNKKAPKQQAEDAELSFKMRMIADSVVHLWAHSPADIDGDGIVDLVYIYENASGGYLAYRTGQKEEGIWKENIIATQPPDHGLFAAGDMECGDMDGDGDIDVLAARHPGEWVNAGAEADLFWYENPGWEAHYIGQVPDAVKDVSVSDFNNDNLLDLAIMTFDSNTLSIFEQRNSDTFERTQFWENFMNLHEGMGLGDVNGDGWNDIVAGAVIFTNPAEKGGEWDVENINEKWNNQKGDWSRNATKAFLKDLDGDGMMEIFISHSERSGYPVCYYSREGKNWVEHIIADSISACHTLQVYDFDLDGNYDVLAGSNMGRAVNLGKSSFEIMVYLANDDYSEWTPLEVSKEGIYNGQAMDYDQDGDIDFFRYPHHEGTEFFIYENLIK